MDPSSSPSPPAHEHGGDVVEAARRAGRDWRDLVDLSASLNPFARGLVDGLVASLADEVRHYPDVAGATAAMATALAVDPSRLVLTNGGAEAIALVAAVERVGAVREPEFSLYARSLERVDPAAPVWRSDPSNPLGRLAGDDERPWVRDEAFYPLATGRWTRGDHDGWTLGSLTKLWACPGLRLGYVVAPDERAADAVRRRQPAWSVGSLAAAIVEPMLERTELARWSACVAARRGELVSTLRGHGLDVEDTDACWVLVHGRPTLRAELADHGVLVRDCTSFGLPGTSRIAVPDDDGLARLARAVAELP